MDYWNPMRYKSCLRRREAVGDACFIAKILLFCALLAAAPVAEAALGASVTLFSGDPGTIYPGQTTRLQITLSNSNTASAINNVGFNTTLPGTLPNGLKIGGAATYTCNDPAGGAITLGTLTAGLGTQAISLANDGVIPARALGTDGTCTIVIPVTAGSSTGNNATYAYSMASGAVTGNDGAAVANVGAVSQSININSMTLPVVNKSFSNSVAFLGGAPVTLTLTVTNNNPIPLPNFSISDVFPTLGGGGAIMQVAPTPAATSACPGGTPAAFAPAAAATSIAATAGTIAANGSCTLTVAVVARQSNGVYDTGPQTNTVHGATDFSNDLGLIPADASAQIDIRSPLRLAKTFAHSFLANGQSDALTVTLFNDGTGPLTVTTLTDDAIDGLTVGTARPGLSVTGQSTTCAGGVTTATTNNTGVLLTGGVIPAGGSCTVIANFTGTVVTPGVPIGVTNTIPQGAVGVTTPGIVSQPASAALIIADDLRITKTSNPAQVAPGNPVQYSVTVENFTSAAITNVVITDALTNGQTYLTGTINGVNYSPGISAGCGALGVTGAVGSSNPVFTIGTLPARTNANLAGSCTVTFYAMSDIAAANGSAASNTLPPGSVCYNAGANCNGGGSNPAGGTVNTAVLSLTKAFNLSSPQSEGTVTRMTLTVSNFSANAITGASIADTLPLAGSGGQMRIATPANAATTCGAGVITAVPNSTSVGMSGGTVPARASGGLGAAGTCNLQVDVVGAAGVYANTATVAGTETYANGTTHTVGPISANANFTYLSALTAAKSFNPGTVSSGGKSTVTVALSNASAVAVSAVAVSDPLPPGMVLANPPNAYTTCAGATSVTAVAGASTLSMSGADIAGGGNCNVLFDVVATGATNWINTIPVGNITASGGISNQSPVTATLIQAAPNNPAVSKATSPGTLTFPGQVSQLTITVNSGNQAITNLRLTDYFTIDGTTATALNGMAVAPSPGASTNCPGGIVSAVGNATSVSLAGVALAANASCIFSVNVTSAAVGGITNFIPPGSIASDQGLTNTGQASTSLTTQSNLGITKQFTPNVIKPGNRSRLRITFYNATGQPVTNLGVLDTLPAGVTIPGGANPATTCVGATVSSPATNQVQVSGGVMAAASGGTPATCYAEIDVTVAVQGDYVNTIPANTLTALNGGIPASNSQPARDTLRAKLPIVVHKAIANTTLDAGNPVGFTTGSASTTQGMAATVTLRLDNPNAVQLTAASLIDSLPSGLVVALVPGASTTCAGGLVTAAASATSFRLTGATLPAAGFCTVSVNVLSNISGTYVNAIPVSAVRTSEGVSNENPSSAQVIVSNPPTVGKQFSPAVIPPNGTSTLSIVLGNTNTSVITLTSLLTDTLPTAPGAIRVAATPNIGGTCTTASVTAAAGGGTITYANGATIPAGGCTISVDVTGATGGVHTNNIPAGALQTNLGNNQQPANATLTISTLGYVTGRVFKDNNAIPNGVFDAGDTALAGTSIELRSGATCAGALVAAVGLTNPVTTDALGNYIFAGLPAGTYSVCEPVQPTGTANGKTTAGAINGVNGSTGSAGTASNPTATTSRIAGIVLNGDGGGGEISGSTGNNFAEIVPSSITGRVFLDQNNDGIQQGADTGVAGVAVNLAGYNYGPDGVDNGGGGDDVAVSLTTTTDASGNYSFANLLPGKYSVTEPTQPPATSNGITTPGTVPNGGTVGTATGVAAVPSRVSNIVLPPNTTASGNNFAEIANGGRISGTIFVDYNNDGLINGSDHGLGGQTVNLTGTDINGHPVTATTTTAADGSYSFSGLAQGTYTVDEPGQPAGTTNGTPTAGSTGGTASNPTATSSRIATIDLTGANTVSANNNFGEQASAPDLALAKTHSPVQFSSGNANFYTLTVSNVGNLPTSGTVTVVDNLPAGMSLFSSSGGGWSCTGTTIVTCTSSAVIAAAASSAIALRVALVSGLVGQLLTNNAVVSGGGEPPGFSGNNTASDIVAVAGPASIAGTVWTDLNHDRVLNPGEPLVSGWTVELLLSGTVIATAITNASGAYNFPNLAPNTGYQVRFRNPASGQIFGNAVPNESGTSAASGVVSAANRGGALTTDGTLKGLTLVAGQNLTQQSLPLDPTGVVYDAVTRQPVSGAVVTITGPPGFNPVTQTVGGSATSTTGVDGIYQFVLLPGAPNGTYTLTVSTYPAGYLPSVSSLVPPCPGTVAIGAAPAPALVQDAITPPASGEAATCPGIVGGGAANSTQYFFSFNLTLGVSADVVNNHIALDPILGGAIVMTKTSPLLNVSRGDLVPYTITATNTLAAVLSNINIDDQLPPGFRYRSGSSVQSSSTSPVSIHAEPTLNGRNLLWRNQTFAAGEKKTWKIMLVVGAGVGEGEYTNQVWAVNSVVNSRVSNVASATVRVVPDPNFDCSDIIGKVFDDKNANGYQDQDEPGIANVRIATPRGLLVTTDADGRFHVTCADVPNSDHGSNFVMKLDERTLPSGYRVTTENPRDVRMTRGKMVKLNFGATVHRVVRLELNGAAFVADGVELQAAWTNQLEALPTQLKGRPSVLRIAYALGKDSPDLARKRLDAVAVRVGELWHQQEGKDNAGKEEGKRNPLVIETELEGAQ